MVRLREIPRTATFAWSPGSAPPLLATGTRAGAVDADFSNETQLELWDPDLGNSEKSGELQPVGSVGVDSRFHDLAWSQPNDAQARGIIAGGLENGAVDMWDASKLQSGSSEARLSRTEKHTGAVKTLQFNPFKHELLATAGAKGELYITDLSSNPTNPFRLGTSAARADDFEALDWNKKVPHILATGSSGGFVTVWDLRAKKESLTLNNYGRKAVSAVAWDPDVPTRLATAIPNDQDPLILMWDLRNSNAPEKVLSGHDQGVLSLSWCLQDSDLLLSCGKDNRTICWNPHTGMALGEYPVVTNWTFQTRWNPHNPSLLATASFDGKIAVQTIQHTNAEASAAAAATTSTADGEDFFSKPSVQPQGATFTLPQAPKWLGRPVGATFGFGGKLVRFGPAEKDSRKSKISIETFAVDAAVGESSEKFEEALKGGDLAALCDSKIAESKTDEEKADWTVIETLLSTQPRKKLMEYLGFADAQPTANGEAAAEPQVNGTTSKDDADFFGDDGSGDNFLSNLASSKGAKTNSPFQLYTGSESDADKDITRYLMLGQFEQAVDICLKQDRLSDAFMIATCGGQKCIDKTQAAYFKQKSGGPNYLRLLASVVGKNLWDFVYNADLKNWKEVMATLCTFADAAEFPDLCEALGDRLEELVQESTEKGNYRKDATFCYLAGSKLEKVVGNWVQELAESETADTQAEEGDSSFSIHARSLQNFIEKVTVFRQATKFRDTEQQKTSDWKLAPLYAKYTEYADVAAAHGQLSIAEKYLDLLPQQYPAAEVARNRVKQATRKAGSQTQRGQAAAAPATQRGQRVVPSYGMPAASATPTPATGAAPVPYQGFGAPASTQPTASPYAPPGANQYQPQGYQQPQQSQQSAYQPAGVPSIPQPPQFGSYQQPQQQGQGLPPPPRGFNASPAVPPAATNKNLQQWNDLPTDFASKQPSRRGTPGLGSNAITSPFPNAQPVQTPGPPMGAPFAAQQRATPPLGPPPRGPQRVTSPPTAGSPLGTQENQPPPSSLHPYAPLPSSQPGLQTQPSIPRGTSPFAPAPSTSSGGPPSTRYAPAPGSTPTPTPGMPPPHRQVAPPPNPYASQPPSTFSSQQPQQQASAPLQPPPRGPPPGGPPRGGPPSQGTPYGAQGVQSTPTPEPESRSAPTPQSQAPQARYPRGDRSNLNATTSPIFEVLSAEMSRVKGKAPAAFKVQVEDTEKRLNILFDQLNEGDVLQPALVGELRGLTDNLLGKDYEGAQQGLQRIMTLGSEGGVGGNAWMVGVKRLIGMSKATPV